MGLEPPRLHRRAHGLGRRPGLRTTARRADRIMFPRPESCGWLARGVRKGASGIETLWEKFADDREFTGLKIMLLAGMVALTALLERAI